MVPRDHRCSKASTVASAICRGYRIRPGYLERAMASPLLAMTTRFGKTKRSAFLRRLDGARSRSQKTHGWVLSDDPHHRRYRDFESRLRAVRAGGAPAPRSG